MNLEIHFTDGTIGYYNAISYELDNGMVDIYHYKVIRGEATPVWTTFDMAIVRSFKVW